MISDLHRVLDLVDPDQRWRALGVLAAMIGTALLQTAGVVSVMPFLALVADPEIVQRSEWMAAVYRGLGFTDPTRFMIAVGVSVILLLAMSNAFSAFSRWLSLRFAWGLHNRLSLRLLKKYLDQDYSFFLERNSSELNKNLLADVRGVIDHVVIPYIDIIARGATILFLLAVLVLVDPLLALVALSTLGGAYAAVFLLVKRKHRDLGLRRNAAFAERFHLLAEVFGGIRDVKVLEREEFFVRRFKDSSLRFAEANTRQAVISEMPRFALETIAFSGIIMTVIYLLETRDTLNEVLPVIGMYTLAGYRLMPALQIVFAGVSNIRFHGPMLQSLQADLAGRLHERLDPPISEGFESGAGGSLTFEREIRFDSVSYRYPRANRAAVEDLDFVIPARKTVALVGMTGSGKTTVVDLLLGLHRPTRGRILIDGIEISTENLSAWRRCVGYVSQSIFLADRTIAQNIAFGLPDELIDPEAVRRAGKAAHLDTFVDRLSAGYETVVGEHGVRLSGGERQRIAIARALYRDPAMLILDEATSALDGVTEDAVMQAIGELSGTKTIVLIAHRLTTVRDCDRIFLMEDGRLLDTGTYAELNERSSTFRTMARETEVVG